MSPAPSCGTASPHEADVTKGDVVRVVAASRVNDTEATVG